MLRLAIKNSQTLIKWFPRISSLCDHYKLMNGALNFNKYLYGSSFTCTERRNNRNSFNTFVSYFVIVFICIELAMSVVRPICLTLLIDNLYCTLDFIAYFILSEYIAIASRIVERNRLIKRLLGGGTTIFSVTLITPRCSPSDTAHCVTPN